MLTRKQRVAYGFARFGSTIFMGLYDFASFYIYWQVFRLDPLLSGYMGAIGKITIMVASLLVGYLSDSIWTRWGRRKPFIATGAPLLAFSGFLHFTPIYFLQGATQEALFLWGAATSSMFHFFYAWLLTPFQAWLPEISEPSERIDISMLQNVANILGNIVSTVTGFLAKMLVARGLLMPLVGAYALVLVALFTPPVVLLPVERRAEPTRPSLKDLLTVFRYREYMKWMAVRGLMSSSVQMLTITIIAYIEKVIGVEHSLASASFGVILVVFVAGAFPLWGRLGKRAGKGRALTLSMTLLGATLLMTPLPHFVDPGVFRVLLGYVLVALGAVAVSAYVLFPYAVLADLAHWYEVQTGEKRAGLFTGFEGIPINVFESLAYLVTGFLMSLPQVPGSEYTYGLILWGPVASLFTLVALAILRRTNVDPFLAKK
ncbi:MFS transporter [Thermofilum pendens]|uniref:Major facilitator superfamily MFS_1 n=1 Tax=Thermofilum pendens (strain DSM 2475 / Hrk 5) TaxID=368408 RepID=A1S196_THEPD|nr:MFS transporter [Thermofilum pendens]ABL79226.1 major facilitator superfamily MFS_1 [Thermofilum pendens Hrk 5]